MRRSIRRHPHSHRKRRADAGRGQHDRRPDRAPGEPLPNDRAARRDRVTEGADRWDSRNAASPGAAYRHSRRAPARRGGFQALPGAGFTVRGAPPARDAALVSVGGELRLANGITLLAKFDTEFSSHAQTYAATGTLRWAW